MRQHLQTFGIGLLLGLSGLLIFALPIGSAWEEDTGLEMLFKLRGQRPAPSNVAVVAISDDTGPQLGLDNDIPNWPRSVHGQLVETLYAMGAAVIVMDIDFRKEQVSDQDEQFAAAIQRAGNVILFGYLEQELVRLDDSKPLAVSSNSLHIEYLRKPVKVIANSAAAIAPFVLPKTPIKVSRFWTFQGANELATLPAAALEYYVLESHSDLRALLTSLRPSMIEQFTKTESQPSDSISIDGVRSLFRGNYPLVDEIIEVLDSHKMRMDGQVGYQHLKALLTMYQQSSYPWLNFYGPPHSITTIPYEDVLSNDLGSLPSFDNKVVFVGYAEVYQPKQKDGLFTVFSQSSGLDLSGVEIAATAFANLMGTETISPLEPVGVGLVMLLYGIAMMFLVRLLPAYLNLLAGLFLGFLYLLFAYQLFAQAAIWLPLSIPLFLLTPLALFLAIILHYREARLERYRLHKAFGYYLPERIVDRLTHDTSDAHSQGESAFGVCLATDAEQYTALAENIDPMDLQAYLNRYYEILFAPVRAHDGIISDVVGDAMLAIWSAPTFNANLSRKACEAALEIKQALNDSESVTKLPTRIGLHAGQIVLSHVGAIDHYEYRAVGDIVNTASRIENMNKQLGTSILASQEMLAGLEDLITRDLGMFRLKGKHHSLILHEIICPAAELTHDIENLLELFMDALTAHQRESWQEAYEKFQVIVKRYPNDGPSQFYLSLYHERRRATK